MHRNNPLKKYNAIKFYENSRIKNYWIILMISFVIFNEKLYYIYSIVTSYIYIYIYRERERYSGPLTKWLECSPLARETRFQSQVESYQRLKKWYLMSPCLTLSIIGYESRVKWSNPGRGVAPFSTPWCSSYWKGSLRVPLDYSRQLYFYFY